jgi:hypothetical protein
VLTLKLSPLPALFAKRGIYPTPSGDNLPERFRFLHPDAARSLAAFEQAHPGVLYFSDVFRSPAGSRDARRRRGKGAGGTMPPGYSHHSYGGAFDVAVKKTLTRSGWTYQRLLDELRTHGWYCHRRDRKRGHEEWHFNYLPGTAVGYVGLPLVYGRIVAPKHPRTWARAAEARIQEMYGAQLRLDDLDVQRALAKLGLYAGDLDGIHGRLTRAAVLAFQRSWDLTQTGKAGTATRRVLACVTAEVELVQLEGAARAA